MYKYIGNGTFLWGIPARNLSDAEAEIYGEHVLLSSGLYEKEQAEEKAVKPKVEDKAIRPAAENKDSNRR